MEGRLKQEIKQRQNESLDEETYRDLFLRTVPFYGVILSFMSLLIISTVFSGLISHLTWYYTVGIIGVHLIFLKVGEIFQEKTPINYIAVIILAVSFTAIATFVLKHISSHQYIYLVGYGILTSVFALSAISAYYKIDKTFSYLEASLAIISVTLISITIVYKFYTTAQPKLLAYLVTTLLFSFGTVFEINRVANKVRTPAGAILSIYFDFLHGIKILAQKLYNEGKADN